MSIAKTLILNNKILQKVTNYMSRFQYNASNVDMHLLACLIINKRSYFLLGIGKEAKKLVYKYTPTLRTAWIVGKMGESATHLDEINNSNHQKP